MKTFCGTLESLTYQTCDDINLVDVSSCPKLKSLKILGYTSSLIPKEKGLKLRNDEFLPELTVLRSHICLGEWTSLFELSSKLTRISIKCCHIGIRVSSRNSNIPLLNLFNCRFISLNRALALIHGHTFQNFGRCSSSCTSTRARDLQWRCYHACFLSSSI